MPGNVINIVAQEGSQVKQGEPVIILEAMKMNNEIPSPVSGIIKEMKVKEGDTIDSEDIIAIIEEESE
jgi:biotin carboxyl carrier protein